MEEYKGRREIWLRRRVRWSSRCEREVWRSIAVDGWRAEFSPSWLFGLVRGGLWIRERREEVVVASTEGKIRNGGGRPNIAPTTFRK